MHCIILFAEGCNDIESNPFILATIAVSLFAGVVVIVAVILLILLLKRQADNNRSYYFSSLGFMYRTCNKRSSCLYLLFKCLRQHTWTGTRILAPNHDSSENKTNCKRIHHTRLLQKYSVTIIIIVSLLNNRRTTLTVYCLFQSYVMHHIIQYTSTINIRYSLADVYTK